MKEDRYDVVWALEGEEPIKFISVDVNEMMHLYKEGLNNKYAVEVCIKSIED